MDFNAVFRKGIRAETEWYSLLYRHNGLAGSRFAVVVRKRLGTSVIRNRAKRRARILFDRFEAKIHPPCDIIFSPRRAMLDQREETLASHFEQTLKRNRLYRAS